LSHQRALSPWLSRPASASPRKADGEVHLKAEPLPLPEAWELDPATGSLVRFYDFAAEPVAHRFALAVGHAVRPGRYRLNVQKRKTRVRVSFEDPGRHGPDDEGARFSIDLTEELYRRYLEPSSSPGGTE